MKTLLIPVSGLALLSLSLFAFSKPANATIAIPETVSISTLESNNYYKNNSEIASDDSNFTLKISNKITIVPKPNLVHYQDPLNYSEFEYKLFRNYNLKFSYIKTFEKNSDLQGDVYLIAISKKF